MDYTELSLSNVHYYPPAKSNNRYIARVLYQDRGEDSKPLTIVTPALKAHSAICVSENRCYIILELDRQHEDLYNFFTSLDDRNIKVMYENSASWFGRTVPLDWLDDNYTTFVKAARPPLIKVRVPHKNGVISIPDLDPHSIEEGTLVKLVLEYQGIKFLRQQASNLWVAKDIRVIADDEDIEYDFHHYDDGMGDLMLKELNLTIQEAITNANFNTEEPTFVDDEPEAEEVGGFEELEEDVVEPEEDVFEPVEEPVEDVFEPEEEPVEEDVFEPTDVEESSESALDDDDDDDMESEELFDSIVDRVLGDVVDLDVLDHSERRRRKKIVVGNRVTIV